MTQCLHFIKHLLCPSENGPGVQIDALIERAPVREENPVLDGRDAGAAETRTEAQEGCRLHARVPAALSASPGTGLVWKPAPRAARKRRLWRSAGGQSPGAALRQ